MKYTIIPLKTFQNLQLNAGILLYQFDPKNPMSSEELYNYLICATSGGVKVEANPTYTDLGEDIDNCPKNTMELKKLVSWEVKTSGTMVSMDRNSAKFVMAAADLELIGEAGEDGAQNARIVPRSDLKVSEDFKDIWWVGDYNNGAGFVAIKIFNALSTGGLVIQSTDQEKGTMDFEFTGHYSIYNQDVVPLDIYLIEDESILASA